MSHDTSKGLSKRARLNAANEQPNLILPDLDRTSLQWALEAARNDLGLHSISSGRMRAVYEPSSCRHR